MAKKRMFSREIVMTDNFLTMSGTARALYFHLGLEADDDGFVSNPKSLLRFFAASEDDLKLLIAKGYLILFESGIVVVTHWRQHNNIAKDRYKPTINKREISQLCLDENNTYVVCDTNCNQNVYRPVTKCIQTGDKLDTQTRLDKIRLDKTRLDKDSIDKKSSITDDISRSVDMTLKNTVPIEICNEYFRCFGLVLSKSSKEYPVLLRYCNIFDEKLVCKAMEISKEKNKDFNYSVGIMKNWEERGITRYVDYMEKGTTDLGV